MTTSYILKNTNLALGSMYGNFITGLFERSHMHFEQERNDDEAGEPSIAEMVEKAIQILRKDPDGFFLAVEGKTITQQVTHYKNQ